MTPALFITTIGVATSVTKAEETEYPYAIVVLDTLGGDEPVARAINDSGVVVGYATLPGNSARHAAMFRPGRLPFDLGTLGGPESFALDINESDEVAGYADTRDRRERAFIYQSKELIEISTGPGNNRSWGYALNDNGTVVGTALFPGGQNFHAFTWNNGVFTDLGALSEFAKSEAYGVNNRGDVVGFSQEGGRRGVLWKDDELIELPSIIEDGNAATEAFAITEDGFIVGDMNNHYQNAQPALWTPRLNPINLRSPGWPPIRVGIAFGINENHQVVGIGFGPKDENENRENGAVIWDHENKLRSLDRMLPPFFPYTTDAAYDINNHGQIAAIGTGLDSEHFRGLVFTPVYPEMSLNIPDGPIRADAINTWMVTGAQPGARITLVYGKEGGGHYVPSCNALKAILQIADPVPFIRATADDEGKAIFEVMVPPRAAVHKGFLIQAIDFDRCEESQLVLKRVE